jgi:m7GpppX diphosphatase
MADTTKAFPVTASKRAREPLPSGLKFVRLLGAAPDARRMFILCDDPLGSGGQAVVAASKEPWTEAELRAVVEGDTNALACVHRNDKFSRHDGAASTAVSLTVVSPANEVDIGKYSEQRSFVVRETAALYGKATRPFVDALPPKQIAWVYAILDGEAEMDRLIYEDEHCKLVPDTKWDRADLKSLYVLAVLKDRSLRSVRDLRGEHVGPLCKLRDGILACLQDKYGVERGQVRAYFHYLPSFWHAHIHVNVLGCPNICAGLSAGKAILLDDVIDWLERDPTHFETAAITFSVGEGDKLFAALKAAGAV